MKIINYIKGFVHAGSIYMYDLRNDLKFTLLSHNAEDDQEMLLSSLVVAAHTIEKGLTMPKKHYPFGEAKAMEILSGCQRYVERGYDLTESRFKNVVGIMIEYQHVNKTWGGVINGKIDGYIDRLRDVMPEVVSTCQKYSINRDVYFSHTNDGFVAFSSSRNSCRNLPGHVSDDSLRRALELSMNAPSTCNRQSHRIHLLQSAESKRIILSIQSGNRGFGDIADQFILITSDLRCWPSNHQRNAPYVDGGIYLMNLLYCLHYERIAACTLNMYLDVIRTQRLHNELNIPGYEVPIALVAIGIPPETFDLASSHRRGYDEITFAH